MTAALEQTRTWYWKFAAADLNDADLVVNLVESICIECEVAPSRRSDLALVIAEVVNNAIDHGVLGLESTMKKSIDGFEQFFITRAAQLAKLKDGHISVSIDQLNNDYISISIEDSGKGFDFPRMGASLEPESRFSTYGRGLLIIHHMCRSMIHLGSGNHILLEFRITE